MPQSLAAVYVHLVFSTSWTLTFADLVRNLKSNSSTWLKQKGYRHFAWQLGYGAFSVDVGSLEAVRRYIQTQ